MVDSALVANKLNESIVRENIAKSVLSEISELCILESIGSTNDYLLQLAPTRRQGFVVCAANQQTAGRGRKGREWQSPADANIYLSVGYRFQGVAADRLSCVSIASGVAVCRVLEFTGLRPELKWPNDILLEGKKLGGILVEARVSSNEVFIVIGVGLNVDMPQHIDSEIDQPWIDMRTALISDDKSINRSLLTGKLVTELCNACRQYHRSAMTEFQEDWLRFDMLKQRDVIICDSKGNESQASVTGFADDCALLVNMDGIERRVYAADVKLRLDSHDCD